MTLPSDGFPWADLGRWFAGELSAEEAESLSRWVASDPERVAVVAALRDAWTAAGAAGEGWDAAAAIRRVRWAAAEDAPVIARLGADAPAPPSRWSARIRPALRVAAIVAVVAGGALWMSRSADRQGASSTVRAGMMEYRTPRGQRLNIRLADGTQVTLAPGSVLRRPADYGRRTRRLDLEGQAYFVVTHDAARPFTVHTPRLVAHDLGTRFVVRGYPGDATAEVFVAQGKVAVQHGNTTPTVLTHDQLALVDATGRLVVSTNVEPEPHLAWTEGQLVFSDTPLTEVGQQFERWYDVDVRLGAPELAGLRVSGVFGNQTIAEELATVARALGLVVRRIDGGYELSRP